MRFLFAYLLFFIFTCCESQQTVVINDTLKLKKTVIYEDDFQEGLENWKVEQQEGGTVDIQDGKMKITDISGCTVWFRKKMTSPVLITYDAIVIDGVVLKTVFLI